MIENFGFGVLVLSLVVSLYGIAAVIYGIWKNRLVWVESARVTLLINFSLVSMAVLCLIDLLATNSYQVAYVFTVTSNSTPNILRLTALWGGESGGLLLWIWILSGCASALTLRKWNREREYLPVVILVLLITFTFYLFVVLNFQNPFVRFWQLPDETRVTSMFRPAGGRLLFPVNGVGLNPMLRSPWLSLYLPILYLGCALFLTPYAFGVAALAIRRTDHRWFKVSHRWVLLGWLFLGLGVILNSRLITTTELLSGFWKWEPTEMAIFLPWLSGTALLHAMKVQEKRALMKRWNMIQALLTYLLALYGIYVAHANLFQKPDFLTQIDAGPMIVGFLLLAGLISLALVIYRWRDLDSNGQLSYLLSKESLLMYSNLIFIGLLLVTLSGLIFPMLAQWAVRQDGTIDSSYYAQAMVPLLVVVLLLMALSQLASWGYSNGRKLFFDLWRLVTAAVGVVTVLFLMGVQRIWALLGFWLVAFVIMTIFFDLFRGALMRGYHYGESFLTGLWQLVVGFRSRLGGSIIHLGLALVAMGVVGMGQFRVQTQETLALGESTMLNQYTITYRSLEMLDSSGGRNVLRAVMTISSNGTVLDEVFPRREFYFDTQQSIVTPGRHGSLWGSLYIVLVDWQPISAQSATFKIYYDPLVVWLWIGVLLVFLGILLVLTGDRSPEPEFRFSGVQPREEGSWPEDR